MKSRLFGAISASILFIGALASPAHGAPISGQGTWETTLQPRDFDGVPATIEGYYDTVLDITWLADANKAGGTMTWTAANIWAAGLTVGGGTNWRLPDTNPIDGTTTYDVNASNIGTTDRGYNISAPGTLFAGNTGSEMSHLFYNTLGNLGYCNPSTSTVLTCNVQTGWGLSNTGPFSNFQPNLYWFATDYAPITGDAWYYYFLDGSQNNSIKLANGFVWAVHNGDVNPSIPAVPIPGAIWLFGSGMIGLIGIGRIRSS